MNAEKIVQEFDSLVKSHDLKRADSFIKGEISAAILARDDATLLVLYNEAMGFCRECGRIAESYEYAKFAIKQAEKMGLSGQIPYATTLLNAANAYRAGGRLSDSANCYEKVIECYKGNIDGKDMLYASLYNNLSLLKQEMNDYVAAKEYLQKALNIVKCNENTEFEEAVTYANLSGTCAALSQYEDAKLYGQTAVSIFRQNNIRDTHYCAALCGLGNCAYENKQYREAADYYEEAAGIIKDTFGETESYDRVVRNMQRALNALNDNPLTGIELCRKYYETYGELMIKTRFAKYYDKMTVGLVGEGSDCFGFDDEISRDHDWGPGFAIWIPDDVYDEIGEQLQKAYDELPTEFHGYSRLKTQNAKGRIGVCRTSAFYNRVLECNFDIRAFLNDELEEFPTFDAGLAAAVNGQIFHEGTDTDFMKVRNKLKEGYPTSLRILKIAQASAIFSQGAQYNYARMMKRKDTIGATMSLNDGIKNALELLYFRKNQYPPHEKWLARGLYIDDDAAEIVTEIRSILGMMNNPDNELDIAVSIQKIGEKLAQMLYADGLISDTDPYLDMHTGEMVVLSRYASHTMEYLAEEMAREEFKAFDKVMNEGGRAGCQDDWTTFRIMRMSQYLTWDKLMLIRYRFDFNKAFSMGRNLIAEKYARMEEYTAPERYEMIRDQLPIVSDEQRRLVNAIASVQVSAMEEFAAKYPKLAARARSIHSSEDTPYNTSYETYLKGELMTYSETVLTMYGRMLARYSLRGINIAKLIMNETVKLYGYKDIEEANEVMRGGSEQ